MTMTEAEIEGLTRFIVRHAVRQAIGFWHSIVRKVLRRIVMRC
jgi:hypothetical protein